MVSIVIVNYKQKDFLLQCVSSVFKQINSYPFEIIIVNNSTEDNLSHITNQFGIRILENENRGYSYANNLGAKFAKGEYLLFLNPDTIIKNDFLGRLISTFNSTVFGAAGLKLLNADETFQISFGYNISIIGEIKNKTAEGLTWTKDFNRLTKIENQYAEIKRVDWVSGAAMLIRREIFDLVKGFDERYFLYYEDSDICKRISDLGYPVFFYPFSRIIHLKGEKTNKNFMLNSYYHSKKSQLIYYKRHRSFPENILLRLYLSLKFLALYTMSFNKNYLRISLLAVHYLIPFTAKKNR